MCSFCLRRCNVWSAVLKNGSIKRASKVRSARTFHRNSANRAGILAHLITSKPACWEFEPFSSLWWKKRTFVYRTKVLFLQCIRSSSERVVYLRCDIALCAMIYTLGVWRKWILYHILSSAKYIIWWKALYPSPLSDISFQILSWWSVKRIGCWGLC